MKIRTLASLLSVAYILLLIGVDATAQSGTWKQFTSKEGAFSVRFPSEPKVTETENKTPEGFTVKVKSHAVTGEGMTAYVIYNEFEAGVNVMDDSLYLATVVEQFGERIKQDIQKADDIRVYGFPAKHFSLQIENSVVDVTIILRTNRAYFITAFFGTDRMGDLKEFVNSFRLLPYEKTTFTPYQSPDHFFTIDLPSVPRRDIENSDGVKLDVYYGLDKNTGNNYSVAVEKYSPYYEAASDSLILERRAEGYRSITDSVIMEKDIVIDGRPAKEMILNQGNRLGEFKSEKSVPFIRKIFPTLKGNTQQELAALEVLVALRTPESEAALIELLPKHTPAADDSRYYHLFNIHRDDSLASKAFLMKIIPQLKMPAYKTPMYFVIQNLMFKKALTVSELAPYKETINADFNAETETYLRDTVYHALDNLIDIIGYDRLGKTEMANLKKISELVDNYLAVHAHAALLRQQQKPNQAILKKLAKDPYFRNSMLATFRDFGIEKFFPKEYYRQDSIAVGEMFSYVAGEFAEPSSVKVVHREQLQYEGGLKTFLVVRLAFPDEEGVYLGVCGPYIDNKIEPWGSLTSFNFDEDKGNYSGYLKSFLKGLEEE